MSSPVNPYQSPLAAQVVDGLQIHDSEGLWRKGKILVMRRNAQLPNRCVKSNQPTDLRLQRNLQWHHPMIALTILIGLLVYIILAVILTKKATIHIGLSDEWFAKRRQAILIGWVTALGSIALGVIGIVMVDQVPACGWLILVGFITFFVGIIYGAVCARMVSPSRIDDEYVWLKGVCPEYLAELPDWPHAY